MSKIGWQGSITWAWHVKYFFNNLKIVFNIPSTLPVPIIDEVLKVQNASQLSPGNFDSLCSFSGFHIYHRLPGLMPESCLLIIVGALVGAIIFGTDHKSPPVMDSSIYFLYLLPPIVLEGGYFMPTRPFFENIGSILWWAGLGALINAFGIGLSLYLICQIKVFGLSDVSLLQNLLFGSLISAVDPVAVLAVFEEARVNEPLYMMIFGEALLNDGISVVRCP